MSDKYTQDEIDSMGAKGHAFGPDDDGHYSYPIGDEEDLKNAIRAVGRGNADHDKIRAYIIKRAKALGLSDLVPDNWSEDGSMSDSEEKGHVWTTEQRDSANDVYQALSGAINDAYAGDSYCYTWVQDWYGDGGDTPYTVVYYCRGDIWAATFIVDDAGVYQVNTADARKVRASTTYIDRSAAPSRSVEWRKKRAQELRGSERRAHLSKPELRDNPDGTLTLIGYASTTNQPYDMGWYDEQIDRGAFKKTLAEDPDVQLLINHTGLPLARTKSGTLRLSEDNVGLRVEADLDPEDPDVQSLRRKMMRGDIDQMSFAFTPTRQSWNDDYTKRSIVEANIHRGDVSVVNQGANPNTSVSMRANDALLSLRHIGQLGLADALWDWHRFYALPKEERAGKQHSAATVEVLTQILNLCSIADDAMDQAQPVLAELLGVDNPDDDDADSGDASEQKSSEAVELETRTQDTGAVARSLSIAEARRELEALRYRRSA